MNRPSRSLPAQDLIVVTDAVVDADSAEAVEVIAEIAESEVIAEIVAIVVAVAAVVTVNLALSAQLQLNDLFDFQR